MTAAILQVRSLRLSFPSGDGVTDILKGIEFDLNKGESLGIIGESGCGKSLTGMSLMGLQPSSAKVTGEALLDQQNLLGLPEKKIAQLRGAKLAMVFQEPMSALNPVQTVGKQIDEVLRLHTELGTKQRRERVQSLMDMVKLDPARVSPKSYPHLLSGGQRQRVMIAMALAGEPDILIADEPSTALDVSVQAEILDLLDELIVMKGKSLILITHDLGVVARACDRVLVMYSGAIVETGHVDQILETPQHPYTQALMKSLPSQNNDTATKRLFTIQGQVPDPTNRPKGCAYRPRCSFATNACLKEPALAGAYGGTRVACFHPIGSGS
ncbi:MAG: ABC transporter ATP-binding protein [Alphaproteobacteria bacterium]